MKTLLQIGVAIVLLIVSVQGGRAAMKHYQFVDAIQEAMLFASSRTEDQIAERVMELAEDYEIPLEPTNLSVQRAAYQIIIDAPYTDTVDLLPGFYSLGGERADDGGDQFQWARERLRALSAPDAAASLREYRALAQGPAAKPSDGRQYGLALAQLHAGYPAEAEKTLDDLLARHPGQLWLELAKAECASVAGRPALGSGSGGSFSSSHAATSSNCGISLVLARCQRSVQPFT